MEVLNQCCAGLDVHKAFLVACRLHVDDQGQSHKEIRKFTTMLADLAALRVVGKGPDGYREALEYVVEHAEK